MERICNICGVSNLSAVFYKGITSRCAECHKAKVRENRALNIEHFRQYDAARFKNDPKVRQRHRRYQATDQGKASMLQSKTKWQSQNPEKRAAHVLLGNAIKCGRVNKPSTCQVCGIRGRIHGHHDDYTKPLDVVWCCPTCHAKIHDGLDL